MKFILFLLCLFGVLCSNESIKSRSYGPFEMILHHIEECNDKGNGNINYSVKTKRFNRTTCTIDIDVELKIAVDDSLTAQVSAAVFTNGGYKDNFWTRDFPQACSAGKMFIPTILRDLGTAIGQPGMRCPIPKGNLSARNVPVSFDFSNNVPMFFYNKYRINIGFTSKNTLHGCFSLFVNVVPKRKTKG